MASVAENSSSPSESEYLSSSTTWRIIFTFFAFQRVLWLRRSFFPGGKQWGDKHTSLERTAQNRFPTYKLPCLPITSFPRLSARCCDWMLWWSLIQVSLSPPSIFAAEYAQLLLVLAPKFDLTSCGEAPSSIWALNSSTIPSRRLRRPRSSACFVFEWTEDTGSCLRVGSRPEAGKAQSRLPLVQ
jgi:hypothetical protein